MKQGKPKPYKIKLVILGKEWTSTGETIDFALAKMGLDWPQIKGKGVVYVSCGDLKHEHLMNMVLLRRIFSNKIVREHWAKNLEMLLKADAKTI